MARNADYRIVPMSQEEIPLLTSWAKAEGWNPGLYDIFHLIIVKSGVLVAHVVDIFNGNQSKFSR